MKKILLGATALSLVGFAGTLLLGRGAVRAQERR